jgi:GR25 family glycosyltransferase involved in LPS biosynthesis
MRAFVICLQNHKYSNQVADRCIASAKKVGVHVEKFFGVDKEDAEQVMNAHNLVWTWANKNTAEAVCPKTKLKQHPYRTRDFRTKIGCSMSHFLLWKKCIELNEPILILEHDSVFLRALPSFEFKGICQINDPANATRRGGQWSHSMSKRGKTGVFEKTWVTTEQERDVPDGLAGNSAYVIKPWAAQELVDKYYELGVWPNDATMCKQLFPYLEEYFPFITKVIQTESTTV